MNRIFHAVVPALVLVVAGKQALTISAASRHPVEEAPVQMILRLADPAVSAIAPPGSTRPGRGQSSAVEIARERRYARHLERAQEQLAVILAVERVRVVARYHSAFNGLCIEARPSDVTRLSHMPGVVSVTRVQPVQRTNSNTIPFIGASTVWSHQSARGAGVRVAVIDSGIDYTHKDFGGPGTVAAYQANDPTVIEKGSFPTAKVVGGYDLVGDDYPKGGPRPDPDPLDPSPNGHGTQVAGIVAGIGVPGQIGPGVAPDAQLLAYKIYGRSGGSTQDIVLQALDRAMDPDGDGSVSDHVDVINISGGIASQGADDPLVIAADDATRLGVIVVGSAGNDGNTPFVVGGPGVAAGAISVGNSYGGGSIFDAIRLNTPATGTLIGAEGALTAPLTAKGVTADVAYVGTASAGVSLLASPKGRIALVDRDGRPFADKVKACQQAGAVAIIVINSSPSAPTTMAGDHTGITIPGVMIGHGDGARLKATLAAGQKLNVTLSNQGMVASPDWADRIDDASSRGPRRGDGLIKPDVVAPGVNIVSACAGTGDRGIPQTGTSAAAPVVAGIAALLRQLHPTWSVSEVKAAIMNSALPVSADGVPYPISRQGAGRVRADVAAAIDCLAIAADGTPSLSFGFVDDIEGWADRQLTITNKGSETRVFTMKIDAMSAVYGSTGVQLTVTPPDGTDTHLTLAPGASVTLDVMLAVNPELLSADLAEYGGSLTFTETTGTGQVLRVPFLAAIRVASAQINSLANRRTFLPNGASAR